MTRSTPSLEYSVHFEQWKESTDLVSEEQVLVMVVADIHWVDTAELGSAGCYKTLYIDFMEYFSSLAACTISCHIRGTSFGSECNAAWTLFTSSTLVAKARDDLGRWALNVLSSVS